MFFAISSILVIEHHRGSTNQSHTVRGDVGLYAPLGLELFEYNDSYDVSTKLDGCDLDSINEGIFWIQLVVVVIYLIGHVNAAPEQHV